MPVREIFGGSKWLLPTQSEYRANLAGMNTFFGAVIGFVIADVQAPSDLHFGAFLGISAAIVICILYISASPYRIAYAAMTILFVIALPFLAPKVDVPSKLQVTLGVWAILTVAVEYIPRRPDPRPDSAADPPASG